MENNEWTTKEAELGFLKVEGGNVWCGVNVCFVLDHDEGISGWSWVNLCCYVVNFGVYSSLESLKERKWNTVRKEIIGDFWC